MGERLDDRRGEAILRAGYAGTAVFVLCSIAATIAPGSLGGLVAVVDLGLFFVGVGTFLAAYVVAIGRSRSETIGVGGLFFLQGCAPRGVQVRFLALLGIQVVVAFATASIRIYSPLAFGILVPMYGIGLAGLWGARHGRFPERTGVSGDLDDAP
jgi:hypothetical protein